MPISIDDHILGKYDTTTPESPYFDGETSEKIYYLCNSCLNSDISDDKDVLLASDRKTELRVHICITCSVCLDDEAYINKELRKLKVN